MFSKLKTQVEKRKKKSSILGSIALVQPSRGAKAQRAKLEKSPIGRLLSKVVSPSFRRWFNARTSPPDPLPSLFLFRVFAILSDVHHRDTASTCARFKCAPVNLFDGPPIRNQYPHLFSINNKSD